MLTLTLWTLESRWKIKTSICGKNIYIKKTVKSSKVATFKSDLVKFRESPAQTTNQLPFVCVCVGACARSCEGIQEVWRRLSIQLFVCPPFSHIYFFCPVFELFFSPPLFCFLPIALFSGPTRLFTAERESSSSRRRSKSAPGGVHTGRRPPLYIDCMLKRKDGKDELKMWWWELKKGKKKKWKTQVAFRSPAPLQVPLWNVSNSDDDVVTLLLPSPPPFPFRYSRY